VFRSLIAGGMAGCMAKTVIAPLDRVKILFQATNPYVHHLRGDYLGVFKAADNIRRQQGFLALYRGNAATLARIFPYAAIQYMSFEQYRWLFNKKGEEKPYTRFLAGACAGATSVFFTYPLDLVRARLAFQVKHNRYSGVVDALQKRVYQEGGFRQLYRGFVPTLLGIVPYAGSSFYTYHTLKAYVLAHDEYLTEDGSLRVPVRLACGAIAGAVGQTFSYPLDVIRRRMQVEGLERHHHPIYRGTWHAICSILKHDGFRGFYVGLSINYVKVAPAVGVSFVCYEYFKELFGIEGSAVV